MGTDSVVIEHHAQLRICHERIGNYVHGRWCNLRPAMWCFVDDYYVCDMHAHTRHLNHHMQSVKAERRAYNAEAGLMVGTTDKGERRKGERRKGERVS